MTALILGLLFIVLSITSIIVYIAYKLIKIYICCSKLTKYNILMYLAFITLVIVLLVLGYQIGQVI